MSTLPSVELGVLGPVQVRQDGAPVAIPGAKPRAILTMLGLHNGSVVPADTLIELLWGDDPPRTAAKALQTHISSLRRTLGDGVVVTEGTGWALAGTEVDASRYRSAARRGRDAAAAGDTGQAVARFEEALALWRGIPELPDGHRGTSEKTRWIEGHAALVEDRADALLATGRAAEIIGELEGAVADAPLRERRWGQLMLALYRAGRQGEALRAYQRARALLADELGIDPGPDLRRLEAAIVAQDSALEVPVVQHLPAVARAVTFLLTDIEGSTAAWEADADAMAVALARHDELVEQVVTSRGGRLIKTRGEGDATFSVFERPSAAAAAAIELQEAIVLEPWALRDPIRIRVALHTGEVELRDGDYFGRAVNRAARLRSLAAGGQILCSGATAELVIDSLPDDVALADLGMRELRNLARPEHVFELRLETADDRPQPVATDAPMERPSLPAVLAGPGPFVGRGRELERLFSAWQTVLAGGTNAVLIAGEPGVGKTRLAGEWSRQAYDQGAVVVYGRCDEDLGAPYQPFAEALRSLVPCLGTSGLRGLRGVEALLALVPGLTDVLPDLAPPTSADPDTERYALFDAVVALLGVASASAPVVLILDDLHWAAKPTLLLLRHLLRFGEQDRVQVIGTYRSTDLDRSHPLAAMLADLHRDGTANRIQLSGLDENDVTAYVAEAGYDDEELARALASVTGGNPFFLIEALRHVEESGGHWDPSTLPQGVREAVSRRLSRLPAETNKALAAAAVVGSRFALELVEHVVGDDLVDAVDEACKAGIVIEEPGGRYRFNHALVRQSLLAELPSVRRMRLHQRIATTLEEQPGADDELLAELAYHYFECAWAGNAAKAVEYCRRAADQAMARLAYEGAADLYDRALHALEELDDELPDREDQHAELLVARCEALLAAGDVASAARAVAELQGAAHNSARLGAWGTCFDGQLSMLIHPERLDEVEAALGAAADKLSGLDDAAGEAKAHTVRASCLARLGRIGDCEVALDDALTAARRSREHRRVNAVLAGAPLAALWGPNPVPRAGGRCLDVVRLLRITTDSPAVEATSTRCQAVLEAFRGRGAAARRMIDSARRTVKELGLRHARLEVEQFAGIVELVLGDPAAAEPHLRKAYNGFRRMGLDADTAETAALLGRTCLALDRGVEADELCTESERLAGNALKASIAWRTLRAQLLSRGADHDEARRVAEVAVSLAERTDLLVDHGDACLTLAMVLGAAGDDAGERAAADRAADLYERKGAAALAEHARRLLGERELRPAATPPETPGVELDNACVRVGERVAAAIDHEAWDEFERLFAPEVFVESRRKIVGFTQVDLRSGEWPRVQRRVLEGGAALLNHVFIAVRGERLALARIMMGTADVSPGAPHDEFLGLYGIDAEGRIALQVSFDVEDIDAAVAELDAQHARFEDEQPQARRLENAASQVYGRFFTCFATRDWAALAEMYAEDVFTDDRRPVVGAGLLHGRELNIANMRAVADVATDNLTSTAIATRGERLALIRVYSPTFRTDVLNVVEIDADERIAAVAAFVPADFDAAIGELDARYIAGEAATHAHTWSVIARGHATVNRRELPPMTPDCVSIDHRRGTSFAPGELTAYFRAGFELDQNVRTYVEVVHRLDDLGAVCTHAGQGISHEGFDAEWRGIDLLTIEGDRVNRCEVFDEADLDTAIAKFEQLSPPAPRLENAASQAGGRFLAHFAAGDWDAMTNMLADNFSNDDRRRVVGSGVHHGPDAEIADLRAVADLWTRNVTRTNVATRGGRLVLSRLRFGDRDQGSEAFRTEVLSVLEINADERIVAIVSFDVDDIDAAFAELDARYLAGEAADHAHTWSIIAAGYASLNRHEVPASAPDYVNIDHRLHATIRAGDLTENLRAAWDLTPDVKGYVEAVHRLSNRGAVVTHAAHGTSQEGLDAEWRGVHFLTLEGGMVNRCEVFDEADLDTAIAKFEQLIPPAPRLENAATRVYERLHAYFAARDWAATTEILSYDHYNDDRRRVVNAGVLHGRDVEIANMQAAVDVGTKNIKTVVIATRGARLALSRSRYSGRDQRPEAFRTEVLNIVEIDADERIGAFVLFDLDDIDAAIAELDARYLAGEAAAHAQMWSVITAAFAALNRHEQPATTPDYIIVDHQLHHTTIEASGLAEYLKASWDLTPDLRMYIEAVHRLNDIGAVITLAVHGTSKEGFDADWRIVELLTIDGDVVNRCEVFDEADVDAAIARFAELEPKTRRLQNAASRANDRFIAYFAARDWDAIALVLADDHYNDDRRRVIGAGTRHGRDADIANLRAIADLWGGLTADVIATRGERLVLSRNRFFMLQQPQAFLVETLALVEIDLNDRVAAVVSFDLDDIDAAIAELDARYLAGEAAAHADAWSVITQAYEAVNRHELPATTSEWVGVDHRPLQLIQEGDLDTYLRATWDVTPDINFYIEAVHGLSSVGGVVTRLACGTSQAGFDAEWRQVDILTVDGGLLNRLEVFDEKDIDAALARFEELHPHSRRLENTASRVAERYLAHFAARDWNALREALTDDFSIDDRRRVVNAGIRHGRDAEIQDLQAAADVGFKLTMPDVFATRGGRLALTRLQASGRDPEAIQLDSLHVVEIDANERLAAVIVFDLDDIGAAFEELDARYLAGEAAAHSHTWSVIAGVNAAINRRELPPTTPGWVNIDHRPLAAIGSGQLIASLRATLDLTPDFNIYTEAVHRLTHVGAVVTDVATGTSQEGLHAEWRMIDIVTVDGNLINHCEIFDEADVDAALTRFEELHPQTRRLENAATRADDRFFAYFGARNWAALAEILADESFIHDRRPVVNAGFWDGRDVVLANMRAVAEAAAIITSVVATRGERLALTRIRSSNRDPRQGEFGVEMLNIVEIDTDERIAAHVEYDVDDVDAAFEELDARYLAGEAAAHSHAWSVITRQWAAFNRHELPAADWVTIDHRPLAPIDASDLPAAMRTVWDLTPDLSTHIEAVHRLGSFGAIVTCTANGTSQEGFDAEWRMIDVLTAEGDQINRCEIFDEADLDAALARFEELQPQVPRLENAASRLIERFRVYFAARNWTAIAEISADEVITDDRRSVVSSGFLRGRDIDVANIRATADVGATDLTSTVIATRGERLVLARLRLSGRDHRPEAFHSEMLGIVEIDADNRVTARILFDLDDINAAFEELDRRYLAGEAAAHAHTWSVITGIYAAVNRRELPATTPDWVNTDHRRGIAFAPGEMTAYIRAGRDLTPDTRIYVEAVHRLSNLGAVFTQVMKGTSADGFDAEWREIGILTIEGDLISRGELFDETDIDAALARFDELDRQAPLLENAATHTWVRLVDAFNRRDVDSFVALMTADGRLDDRRKGLRALLDGPARRKAGHALFEVPPSSYRMEVEPIAIRGSRLSLTRERYRDTDDANRPVVVELLTVMKVSDGGLMHNLVSFDPDDINTAFEELDAWYLAGEAAVHAHTWSVIAAAYAGLNRRELPPTTPDWVNVDRRRVATIAPGDLIASLRGTWDLMPDFAIHIQTVHRLTDLGAAFTYAALGTSQDGFDAEWREIAVLSVEGDLINHCELFDEADIDAALARFDELDQPALPK